MFNCRASLHQWIEKPFLEQERCVSAAAPVHTALPMEAGREPWQDAGL